MSEEKNAREWATLRSEGRAFQAEGKQVPSLWSGSLISVWKEQEETVWLKWRKQQQISSRGNRRSRPCKALRGLSKALAFPASGEKRFWSLSRAVTRVGLLTASAAVLRVVGVGSQERNKGCWVGGYCCLDRKEIIVAWTITVELIKTCHMQGKWQK